MNELKRFLYNAIRSKLKRVITGDLGKVIEEEEKIICYVNKNKCNIEKYRLIIECLGINCRYRDLAKAYNLYKPIIYIIDGLEVDKKKTIINGYGDCDIIIKNCKFNHGLSVNINDGECTLMETFIESFDLLSIYAKKININNMDININNVIKFIDKVDAVIKAWEELNITDSNIGNREEKPTISLNSKKNLNIINSSIASDELDIRAENINTDDTSFISACDKINIEAKNIKISKIKTPSLIVNDEVVQIPGEAFSLNTPTTDIEIKWHELVRLLKKIKMQCEESILDDVRAYESSLCSQSVSKRLIKKDLK